MRTATQRGGGGRRVVNGRWHPTARPNRRLLTSQSHDAPSGAHGAIQERFDDLEAATATDRCAKIAVAPPAFVLAVEDRAGGNDADAARIVAALSSFRMVLPDHHRFA